MKHIHGVEVRLTDMNDNPITEAPPHKDTALSLLRFNGQVGSRNICLQPGEAFKVRLKLHKRFKIYKAEGVKVVIVANGEHPGYGEVHQRHGLWWIDVNRTFPGAEYTFSAFAAGTRARAKEGDGDGAGFLIPEPDMEYESATTNWVTQEHYCANKGCVAVFVERGKLVKELQDSAKSANGNSSQTIPISYDDFVALNSPNANPYIFEFRNVEAGTVNRPISSYKTDEFGGEPLLVTSNTNILYDTESDSVSEEEAEATDSNDSESESESESEFEFAASEDSEDASPQPFSRKRKAPEPQKSTSSKRRNMTAEKNADADATNATLASARPEYDQDDEEIPLARLKREPTIKQERSESSTRVALHQGPSAKAKAPRGRIDNSRRDGGRRTEVIDPTLDDSADEGYEYDKIASFRAFRKLSGLGVAKHAKGKKGEAKMIWN